MYTNYEVLVYLLDGNIIDFSKAEIYKLKTSKMDRKELEEFLSLQNNYSLNHFVFRYQYLENIDRAEKML